MGGSKLIQPCAIAMPEAVRWDVLDSFSDVTLGVTSDPQVERLLGKGVARKNEGDTGGRREMLRCAFENHSSAIRLQLGNIPSVSSVDAAAAPTGRRLLCRHDHHASKASESDDEWKLRDLNGHHAPRNCVPCRKPKYLRMRRFSSPVVALLEPQIGNRRHTAAKGETTDYAPAFRRAVDWQQRCRLR